MLRRLRAGASSAICLLFVFAAALPAAVPAPCPALEAARSDAQASSDSKAAELALEAASETCASPLAAPETATAPPAFDTEVEPNDAPNTPTAVFFYGGVAVIAGEINGAGDVDYFRIDVGSGVATVMAELFYDITYGDLDVAVLDAGGTMLGSDGTAVSNGCATGPVATAGTYFIVVVGANDLDVNRYDLRVTTYTKITTCPTTPSDMGAP